MPISIAGFGLRQVLIAITVVTGLLTAYLMRSRLKLESIEVFDLAYEAEILASANAEQLDVGKAYYDMPEASVHLHLMSALQRSPLHVHLLEHELAIIVSGGAVVTHEFVADTGLVRTTNTLGLADVVHSPPRCAHEWVNRLEGHPLATLVFAWPRFRGNLFVGANDPKLSNGKPPTLLRIEDEMNTFAQTGEETIASVLPGSGDRIRLVQTNRAYVVEQSRATVILIRSGAGILRNRFGRTFALGVPQLAVLKRHHDVTITPQGSLAMLIFHAGPA